MARRSRSKGTPLALGACRIVTNGRTKRRIQLCRTGRGKTGYEFKPLRGQ